MSHEDAVFRIPKNFKAVAYTKSSKLTIIENTKDKIYGVQFHPEVTHTDDGKQIFKNFLFSICKIKKKWNISSQKKINKRLKVLLKKIKLYVLCLVVWIVV